MLRILGGGSAGGGIVNVIVTRGSSATGIISFVILLWFAVWSGDGILGV